MSEMKAVLTGKDKLNEQQIRKMRQRLHTMRQTMNWLKTEMEYWEMLLRVDEPLVDAPPISEEIQ